MKVRSYVLFGAISVAMLSSCIDKDLYDPSYANELREAQYAKAFKQVFGEIDPNHDWGFGTTRSAELASRALGDYTTPSGFASEAGAVVAYEPTYASAPDIPTELGAFYETKKEVYNPGTDYETSREWEEFIPLCTGKSYVITADEYDKIKGNYFQIDSSKGGYVDIYVLDGAVVNRLGTDDNSKIRYFVMEGAELTLPENTGEHFSSIYNWGTLNVEVNIQSTGLIENYGEITFADDKMMLAGTLYTNKDLTAQIEGANGGHLYVDGNYDTNGSFGHSGTLYVSGTMSGTININNGLAAHVGSIKTNKQIFMSAGSQLMVEGKVTAPSLKLDGKDENGNVAQVVIKGKADIKDDVDLGSGTKAYFEEMSCENYTANASEVWIGCSLNLPNGKFELNGGSEFTLTAGVYLNAGSAVFAADTKMVMMSKAYFKVEGKLQLNNANTNEINGAGPELAIVQAATMGANYENFENTFTGNIGVDFKAWDYNSSTGLIDNNINLKQLSTAAASVEIPATDCSPGYKKEVDKEKPTAEYRVYAEDLGAIGDFDFNDVVFDVLQYQDRTEIVLQAAGGTLPSYLKIPKTADSFDEIDVHQMFGVDYNIMVNTGGVSHDPVVLTYAGKTIGPGHVKIYVTYDDGKTKEIETKQGEAPGKFTIPTTGVKWSPERVSIADTYEGFKTWVGNKDYKWWEYVLQTNAGN